MRNGMTCTAAPAATLPGTTSGGTGGRNAPNGCFLPLSLGHCAHPRMKDRREDQSCPLWIPRTPDQDPPDTRLPGANAPDR